MSQSGMLVFYRATRPLDAKQFLETLLIHCGVETVGIAARSLGEEQAWKEFCAERDGLEITPVEDEVIEHKVVGPAALAQLYKEGTSLLLDVGPSQIGRRVWEAVKNKVGVDIRGGFVPASLLINLGYHDLFECAEHDEGLFIARPFVSISFFGYESPSDWPATREAILALPEVRQVKRELEQVCGKLDECIFWNI